MPRLSLHLAAATEAAVALAVEQSGVVTSAQAAGLGVTRDGVERLVASGRWRRLHRGVYLTGPGEPDLRARMWGAHLALGPSSVVGGTTAGRAWGLLDGELPRTEPITMVMPDCASRRAEGVIVRRVPRPELLTHPARVPPILTLEHTLIELLQRAGDTMAATALVLRACRLRLTTPERILAAAQQRPRIRGRALLMTLCADAADGVTSPLESEYRTRVERAHALPRGVRQQVTVTTARRAYRDVRYPAWGVLVELDGRLGHEAEADVLRDQFRDNVATLTGEATLRYGWLGVMGRPCDVASQVEALLRQRGWSGRAQRCGGSCHLERRAA